MLKFEKCDYLFLDIDMFVDKVSSFVLLYIFTYINFI